MYMDHLPFCQKYIEPQQVWRSFRLCGHLGDHVHPQPDVCREEWCNPESGNKAWLDKRCTNPSTH